MTTAEDFKKSRPWYRWGIALHIVISYAFMSSGQDVSAQPQSPAPAAEPKSKTSQSAPLTSPSDPSVNPNPLTPKPSSPLTAPKLNQLTLTPELSKSLTQKSPILPKRSVPLSALKALQKTKPEEQKQAGTLPTTTLKAASCREGNLLYKHYPVKSTYGVRRSLRMTDGVKVRDGSFWSLEQAAILNKRAQVTYDLGDLQALKAFTLQGDNNDHYQVYGSSDNKQYRLLWTAANVKGSGVRTRKVKFQYPLEPVRYLRIKGIKGDGKYSVTEVQAYCEVPQTWPPQTALVRGTHKDNKDTRKHSIGTGKIGLALFGLLVFLLPRMLVGRRKDEREELADQAPEADDQNVQDDQGIDDEASERGTQKSSKKDDSEASEADDQDDVEGDQSISTEADAPLPQDQRDPSPDTHDETQIEYRWLKLRGIFTYLATAGVAIANLMIGGTQIYRCVDTWADRGIFQGGIWQTFWSDAATQKLTLINGYVQVLFSLVLLLWLLYHVINATYFARLIPRLQSWGIIGVVVAFMCHADEELGKRTNWWPEGWEGLVVIALVVIIYGLYHLTRADHSVSHIPEDDPSRLIPAAQRALRGPQQRVGWMLIVACGLFAWFGFGAFHGSRITHFWDSFHYYVGSKYFPETRYHLIYHCTTLAELDDGREAKLKGRELRNLTTNKLEKKKSLVIKDKDHQSTRECRAHFSPERWRAFKQDIRLFRSYMGEAWWKRMFKDHGYNPTPVWTMIGTRLTQYGWQDHIPPEDLEYKPALGAKDPRTAQKKREAHDLFQRDKKRFEQEIINLNLIDIALYFLIFLLYLWAFGLEITAFTLLIFGTGYPWSFDWTGGSVGRAPWLFMLASGLCFLKRGIPLLSGVTLGWALLLRIFPGAILGGAAVQLVSMIIGKRSWGRTHAIFAISGLSSLVVLVAASMIFVSGANTPKTSTKYHGKTAAFSEFISNSLKHKNTPLSNNMGYQTVTKFSMRYIGVKEPTRIGNTVIWSQEIAKTVVEKSLLIGILLLAFWAFYYLRDRWTIWETTAASVIFLFTVFELTCYYYSFIILLAPLAYQRARDIFWLILFVVASQIVQIQIGSTKLEYVWESIFAAVPIFGVVLGHVWEKWRGVPSPQLPREETSLRPST